MLIFTDPVLNVRIEVSDREVEVLQDPGVERLSRIKQNGFAYLRFPRAKHTRFEHSVGVLYWATLMHRTLLRNDDLEALRIAALVHDVGHGPFSHAMELLLRRNPEWRPEVGTYTVEDGEIVRTGARPAKGHLDFTLEFVATRLPSICEMAPQVFRILSGEAGILSSIISSDVDADRMDYLIRDAYYSGIPFGRGLGDLFRSVVRDHMKVGHKAGREWIVVEEAGIRGIEIILAARFAAYRTIYHDPLARTAESALVEALESVLEGMDAPDAIKRLFTVATDDDFHNGRSDDPVVDEVVSSSEVRRVMEGLDDLKPWHERRMVTLSRKALYNLIKVFENGRVRELERGLEMTTNRKVTLNISLPNTLSPDLCVDDPYIHPSFRPAFLYDYSSLVKSLEDAMFSTGTLLSSVDLTQEVRSGAMEGLLDTVGGRDVDTDRDVISGAILRYVVRVNDMKVDTRTKRRLQRRSMALFEFPGRVMRSLGRDAEVIPEESPYYGEKIYTISRLLVFLRALVEIPDDAPQDGMYIPSYICIPGPGIRSVLRSLALSREVSETIDRELESFLRAKMEG